jgi:hypothetical protein
MTAPRRHFADSATGMTGVGFPFVVLLSTALLQAQSARFCGPGHIWWEAGQGGNLPWEEQYDTPEGILGIVNGRGAVHTGGHTFFEALGTNGPAGIACHQPSNAMSISTATSTSGGTKPAVKTRSLPQLTGRTAPACRKPTSVRTPRCRNAACFASSCPGHRKTERNSALR